MSYLTERAAYLKGYSEGLGYSENTNECKLFVEMIDLIQEMADEISLLEEKVEELEEEIEYYDDLDDDDLYDDEDDEDFEYFEVECEKCGNKIYLDEDILEGDDEIRCPKCGEIIEIEFEDCCDCDDCDGDCC